MEAPTLSGFSEELWLQQAAAQTLLPLWSALASLRPAVHQKVGADRREGWARPGAGPP